MKIVGAKKPKGYLDTKIYFPTPEFAEKYVHGLHDEFFKNKSRDLEYPSLSKRKRKNLMFSKPSKYLLTKVGSKYLLWQCLA